MWNQLKEMSLQAGELSIAKRCAAAVGDIALSRYLAEIIDVKKHAEEDIGNS